MNNLLPLVLRGRTRDRDENETDGRVHDDDNTNNSNNSNDAVHDDAARPYENPFGTADGDGGAPAPGVEGGGGGDARIDVAEEDGSSKKGGGKGGEGDKQWVPDNDMVEFFQSIKSIDECIGKIKREIVTLNALHIKSKVTTHIAHVRELREDMAEHIKVASRVSKAVLAEFKSIESTSKAKVSALSTSKQRMRSSILAAKRKQYHKIMSEFSGLRSSVQSDYKEIVIRRYQTVTGQTPTSSEVDDLIETGGSESIFQKAILEQGRGQVQDTIHEIDERHRAMQEIERGLLGLQQIFIDFATVVDQQSEVIDNIERHVGTTADFTEEGTKALQISATLHKAIQRKKFIVSILVIIAVVILALILWPIISRIIDSANASAAARGRSKDNNN